MFERLRKAYWRVKLNWMLRREGYCTKHYTQLQSYGDGETYCLQCQQEFSQFHHRNAEARQQKLEDAAKLLKELRENL
jgi:hypothetical protein